MKRIVVLLIVLLAAAVSACSSPEESGTGEENEDKPLHIYTTLAAWKDFAEQIGGGYVEVENLVPAGADPHSFEPTSQTMIDIAESDAFMYNGAGMEGFADAVNETASAEGVRSIEVTKDMELEAGSEHSHEEEGDHHHGSVDPHVWLDPVLAKEGAETIKEALIELRPEQEETFEKNYKALAEKLDHLDKEFREMADAAENKTFIVAHAAYGYWENRYGLEQMAVTGLSPSDEPSQKELQSIIDTMEENGISYVLLEQNVSSKVTEVVQKEADAKALFLHNISTLTKEEIESGEDYFSLMQSNLDNLETALEYSEDTESGSTHNHENDE